MENKAYESKDRTEESELIPINRRGDSLLTVDWGIMRLMVSY